MILDVNVEQEQVTALRWITDPTDGDFDLIREGDTAVTLPAQGLKDIRNGQCGLCDGVKEAEGLIKALQKAIDLGWLGS